MDDPLSSLSREIALIQSRNARVEADKAWESSRFRIGSLCLITYFFAAAVMAAIGVRDFWLSALIPTLGYFLSTQSLPLLKKLWLSTLHKPKL